ncbi:MAG: type II toxin-antitoxin system RatA family toxin [Gammaproteobacteria bacterium]
MHHINRSALVPYSAQQMFDLVNDIESYPQFMPGCKSARVLERSGQELLGELVLSRAGISQRLVTRNQLLEPASVTMQLEEGAFSSFVACWKFVDLLDQGCKTSLDMEFEFSSRLLDLAARALFHDTANSMVDTVVARAAKIYRSKA